MMALHREVFMLNDEFVANASDLIVPSMGTEVVAPFLYNLIMFERPRRVLEIGAGYTSMYILKALFDCNRLIEEERNNTDADSLILPDYFDSIKPARLHIIDDLSHGRTSADKVVQKSQDMGFQQLLMFHEADFSEYADKLPKEDLPLDLIWLDCGSLAHYEVFKRRYFPLVNKNGGLIVIHSLLTNFHGQIFLKNLKLEQATVNFNKYELMSIQERHKLAQNSMTILRFTEELKTNIYSVQS
jgi:predicted O-methyltransferase YrrM